jgi:diguanylate cyclase (GGDEF)-like protein
MKVSRILVLQERAAGGRELRFDVLDHAVEFEFRPPELVASRQVDASSYAAIAAPVECARPDLLDTLGGSGGNGAPVFLYRGDPPLHEVARWAVLGRPSPSEGEESVSDRLLVESLEYYSMASLYQQCLRLMSTQDEEKLVSQITETFTGELGAESCVVWLVSPSDPDEMLIASVRGVIGIDREGSRFFLSQSEAAEAVWKGEPYVAAAAGKGETGASRSGSTLYVPLLHQGKPTGVVKLGDRLDRRPYGTRDLHRAKVIAGYAAAALNTVDRLGRIGRDSLHDPETGVYSAAFHEDYFKKERFKAARFRRPLSVIFLVVENYSLLLEQTRESVVTGVLSAMIDTVQKALRDSDLVSRQEPNRFCIVLPETDAFGAMLAVRRLRNAVREKSRIRFLGTDYSLQPLFLSATWPRDGKDFPELLRVAEQKYARKLKSPLHRQRLADRTFWDAFQILVGKAEHYEMLRRGEDVPYFLRFRKDLGRNGHFSVPRETYLRILESVAQDVANAPEDRGLVVVAGPTPEIYKQIFLSFDTGGVPRRSIYIVGQSGDTRFDAKNMLYVCAEDESLRDREVILCLKENGAYGLFGVNREEEVDGFNTADEWLVEAMLEKVQEMYHLQGIL